MWLLPGKANEHTGSKAPCARTKGLIWPHTTASSSTRHQNQLGSAAKVKASGTSAVHILSCTPPIDIYHWVKRCHQGWNGIATGNCEQQHNTRMSEPSRPDSAAMSQTTLTCHLGQWFAPQFHSVPLPRGANRLTALACQRSVWPSQRSLGIDMNFCHWILH